MVKQAKWARWDPLGPLDLKVPVELTDNQEKPERGESPADLASRVKLASVVQRDLLDHPDPLVILEKPAHEVPQDPVAQPVNADNPDSLAGLDHQVSQADLEMPANQGHQVRQENQEHVVMTDNPVSAANVDHQDNLDLPVLPGHSDLWDQLDHSARLENQEPQESVDNLEQQDRQDRRVRPDLLDQVERLDNADLPDPLVLVVNEVPRDQAANRVPRAPQVQVEKRDHVEKLALGEQQEIKEVKVLPDHQVCRV